MMFMAMLMWAVEFQTHEIWFECSPAVNIIQDKMQKILSYKWAHFRRVCLFLSGHLTELFGGLKNDTPPPSFSFKCVTVHWFIVAQVIWPGTQPSSTRFRAIPHPSGPSRAHLGSLGDQVHLGPRETKDLQALQASQEMQVCQGPQENEVSWATSFKGYPQGRGQRIRMWLGCLYSDRDWNNRTKIEKIKQHTC